MPVGNRTGASVNVVAFGPAFMAKLKITKPRITGRRCARGPSSAKTASINSSIPIATGSQNRHVHQESALAADSIGRHAAQSRAEHSAENESRTDQAEHRRSNG